GASIVEVDGRSKTLASANTIRRGSPRLAIVEFSDFQCPFCGMYARNTFGQLQREFVESGLVEYVFRHFPVHSVHPSASLAADIAECAGQQSRFWEMSEWLFAHQMLIRARDWAPRPA